MWSKLLSQNQHAADPREREIKIKRIKKLDEGKVPGGRSLEIEGGTVRNS